jgi:NAD(P)-dependent dehydrogenase (short-subunit alcohol dehydrogenase family)
VTTPTVLVTGAGRGIGRATVEGFLDAGWQAVAGVRDVAAARSAYTPHPRLTIVELDVGDSASIAAGTAAAHEVAGGALSCVVPNAGYAVMGSSEDVDLDVVRRMFEVNLFGNVDVIQHALPAMREAGRGVIVCTSSIGARLSNPLLGMYHASKYGMMAWAEAMRLELLPFGVRVHVVEPGMVNTEFPAATTPTGAVARGEGPYAPLLGQLRTGFRSWRERLGVGAEDVAAAIIAIALDDDARFCTPVGPDALQMTAARAELDDEDFQAWQLRFLGISWGQDTAAP